MSCIKVDDKNYDALLTFISGNYYPLEELNRLGIQLKQTNLDSLRSRYGDPAEVATYEFKRKLIPDTLNTAVTILKLCDYYEYQSCEAHMYEMTKASKFIQAIRKTAISKLRGYDDAPWGLHSND